MCQENCSCNEYPVWIPKSSKISVKINKEDPENPSLYSLITPPAGYVYIGKDSGGDLHIINQIKVSCSCAEGPPPPGEGQCNPVYEYGSGKSSCESDGCEKCGKPLISGLVSGTFVDIVSGGFVCMAQGIDIINDPNTEYPAVFNEMFEVASIQTLYNSFLERVYGENPLPTLITGDNYATAPYGYSFAAVNICGRAVAVVVPNSALVVEDPAGATATCSCNDGTCSLSTTDGSRASCYGGCKGTCTLDIGVFSSEGVFIAKYSSVSYEY